MKKLIWIIIGLVVCIIGISLYCIYNNITFYGFVDSEGKFIFPLEYRKIELCKGDGGVCVSVKNKSGYDNYDENGKFLFKSKYPCQEKFGDYYIYSKRPYKFGVVMDKTGKVISKHKGSVEMHKFLGCDVAYYRANEDAVPYCVNITAKADNTKDILENVVFPGQANVYQKVYFKENGKYGLYDFDGNIIAKPVFSKPVEDAYKNMYIQGDVLIDEKENVLFDSENYYDKRYKDNNIYETKFNIIDKKLYITFYNPEKKKYVTYCEKDGRFEDAGFCLEQVDVQLEYSYITSFVDNIRFESVQYERGFCNEAFCYKYNNKMLVTDWDGNTVVRGDYDELRSYEPVSRTCIVKKNGKYGVVANGGKVILPFVYDNIDFVTHNNTLFAVNGNLGIEADGYVVYGKNMFLIDSKGKTILDDISSLFVSNEYAYAKLVNDYIIYDMKGRKVTVSKEYKHAERINRSGYVNPDFSIREKIIKKNKLNKKEADHIRRSIIYYSPDGYVVEYSKKIQGDGIHL